MNSSPVAACPDIGLFASLITELLRCATPSEKARILARDGRALVALWQVLSPLMECMSIRDLLLE